MLWNSVHSGTCRVISTAFLLAVPELTSWCLAAWGAR